MSRVGKTESPHAERFGFAEMLRDVLLASITRGQFPVALIALIVLAVILRMPSADVSRFAFYVVDLVTSGRWLGYVMSVTLLWCWVAHVRALRRAFDEAHAGYLAACIERSVAGRGSEVKS